MSTAVSTASFWICSDYGVTDAIPLGDSIRLTAITTFNNGEYSLFLDLFGLWCDGYSSISEKVSWIQKLEVNRSPIFIEALPN